MKQRMRLNVINIAACFDCAPSIHILETIGMRPRRYLLFGNIYLGAMAGRVDGDGVALLSNEPAFTILCSTRVNMSNCIDIPGLRGSDFD